MNSRERHFFRRLLQSKIFFVMLVIITLLSLVRMSNEIARRSKINSEITKLKTQTEKLRAERKNLSALIEYLSTDTYIEEAAREKLNLSRPGEKLFIINQPYQQQPPKSSDTTVALWWEYFFGDANQ